MGVVFAAPFTTDLVTVVLGVGRCRATGLWITVVPALIVAVWYGAGAVCAKADGTTVVLRPITVTHTAVNVFASQNTSRVDWVRWSSLQSS